LLGHIAITIRVFDVSGGHALIHFLFIGVGVFIAIDNIVALDSMSAHSMGDVVHFFDFHLNVMNI
jgi:hypothetical protein